MQISVTFRNMEPSEALKNYAEEKMTRLSKYVSSPVDVQVVLAKQKFRSSAEIKLVSGKTVLKCAENTEDMYSSIDLALDKIERQARKYKDKSRDHRPTTEPAEFETQATPTKGDEEGIQVVENQQVDPKPMSVDEAIMQMNMLGQDFLVFVNANTHEVNVVYLQKNGNIGVIEAKVPRGE